jgi:hypothetical protein
LGAQETSAPCIDVMEIVLRDDNQNQVKPSDLLSCSEWITSVCELFSIGKTISYPASSIDNELKEKADMLAKVLRRRMPNFLSSRISNETVRSHWAIKLAGKNLSFVAAYMVLVDHVKADLSCLDDTKSLLANRHSNRFILCDSFPNHEGTYLYYDNNIEEFIRSGKVCGRGFVERHKEHSRESRKEGNGGNHFYFMYPTKENVSTASRSKQGWFESLTQFIAAGFDPRSTRASLVDKNYSEGGVLILNRADKEKIRASMRQNPNVLQKFHSFLAYQVEFGYDIALAPGTNVSRSLGFESFVGLFGR